MKDKGDSPSVGEKVALFALRDRSWMRNPQALADVGEAKAASTLTIVEIAADGVFAGTQFFAVTDPTEKPGSRSIVVAITSDQQSYRIASDDDFQQLISHLQIRIRSKAETLEVTEQYLRIRSDYPQYWERTKILNSSEEIPLNPDENLPADLRALIKPPQVEEKDDGFSVQLFTWSETGGELKQFDFRLSKEGMIAVKETVLREGVGKAWLPK